MKKELRYMNPEGDSSEEFLNFLPGIEDGDYESADGWEDADDYGDDYEYMDDEDDDYEYANDEDVFIIEDDYEGVGDWENARGRRRKRMSKKARRRRIGKAILTGGLSEKRKAQKKVLKRAKTARRRYRAMPKAQRKAMRKKIVKRMLIPRPPTKKDIKKVKTMRKNMSMRERYTNAINRVSGGTTIKGKPSVEYIAMQMGLKKPASRPWSAEELKSMYTYASKNQVLLEAAKNDKALGVYEANKAEIGKPYIDWYVENREMYQLAAKQKNQKTSAPDFANFLVAKYKKTVSVSPDTKTQVVAELKKTAMDIKSKEKAKADKAADVVNKAVAEGQDVDEVETEETSDDTDSEVSTPATKKIVQATDDAIYKFFKFFKL